MEIKKKLINDAVEIGLKGKIDAYWSDHLSRAIAEVIHEGNYKIRLNMAEVTYISSMGIRVLLKYHNELASLKGALIIPSVSAQVNRVLEISGFQSLLSIGETAEAVSFGDPASKNRIGLENARFDIFEYPKSDSLVCSVIGNPEPLKRGRFSKKDSKILTFPESTFAIGLGALGNDFEECSLRFGEFLAVAGSAVYLPTDGTNVPDYLIARGNAIPEMNVFYCLLCDGAFTNMVRFESKEHSRSLTVTEIANTCLKIADAELAGIVMIAESAGLTGAYLKRSPITHDSDSHPLEYPEIRDWLSFTYEHSYNHCSCIVAGIAANSEFEDLNPLLRSLGSPHFPIGHFHASVFSYRPLIKGEIDLKTTVSSLFESESPLGVLHLLNDDRDMVGTGQSEFFRGACWVAPVSEIKVERS